MKRAMFLFASMILCAGTTIQAKADGIPGTMNFRNVTRSMLKSAISMKMGIWMLLSQSPIAISDKNETSYMRI